MSDAADLRKRILDLPPKRLALLALELQEQLDRERAARAEPIAVVGMACRFPGGSDSPEALWSLLDDGRDAIVEVPADRWSADEMYDPDPDAPGKVATKWGGYLDDVQRFDAGFFSISPREARAMDPQQRILLETCWRAFEDAGIPPAKYFGAKAGVFIGICNNDYLVRLLKEGAEAMDLYLSSGNAYSVAAGRLSFTLGFQGPAVAVDTACSSSLVAIHAACQSLRLGESTFAVAGGVNVMCSAETSMALSRSHMMAPDGRCKTFDDAADGFVRAEGCGVLLLKRLSDAQRDGDRIHAVLRGSATNQDGRSTGLTVPNGPAQEQVVREALAGAGLTPDDIDYIEAHGTGTSLGDPIEIRALGRVFGASRAHPLYVGSVKTNFGHLESAAGVAGVIKTIMSIRAGRIPRHLHFSTPSRHIEWDEYAIRVPADAVSWPDSGRPRRAGVSSFGFSGTNAHIIIEQAPASVTGVIAEPVRSAELIPLSGMTSRARDLVAGEYAAALDRLTPDDFRDFAHTVRAGRTHFGHRRAVVAGSALEAAAALRGSPDHTVFDSPGRCGDAPGIVFMFTGQGAQHPGMGRALYETAPAFRDAIDRCARILDPLLEMPLTRVLLDEGGDDAPIYQTTLAQPAIVAFEYALAELWRSWGVRPAAVIGHSLGEFVAATLAGVIRLEDMLPLVRERGRLLASLPGGQRMAAVFASADTLAPMIAAHPGTYVAAYNAPENTVISGDAAAVDALLIACAQRGIEHRVLRLEQAFHSPGVEPVMDALEAAAARIEHAAPRIPIAWNVTGAAGGAGASNGAYWRRHARGSVHFTQGVRALADQGYRHFLEAGPHPTLSPLVGQAVEDAVVIPSMRRGGDSWRDMMDAAAQLYVYGVDLDWAALDSGLARRRTVVPVHPFEGERYWVDSAADLRSSAPRGAVPGIRVSAAVPIFETVLTPQQPVFLDQHRFRGMAVVPGPLFAELARRAATAAGLPAGAVADLVVRTAAFVPDAGVRMQTVLDVDAGGVSFRVLSAPAGTASDAVWTEHAAGRIVAAAPTATSLTLPADGWRAIDVAAHLDTIRALGFELGADAALYEQLEIANGAGRARLRTAAARTLPSVAAALAIDAALQVLGAVVAADRTDEARMLTGIDRIEYTGDVTTAARCEAVIHAGTGATVRGDAVLYDERDAAVARVTGVSLGRVGRSAASSETWFHELQWSPAPDRAAFGTQDIERAAATVAGTWSGQAAAARLPEYVAWLPGVRNRVARYAWSALTRLGMPATGELPEPTALAAQLGIALRHHRLLHRLLEIMTDAGMLVRSGDRWFVSGTHGADAGADTAPAGCDVVLTLVDRCGEQLDSVLTGALDPVNLLFPDGAADVTRAIYRSTPFGIAFNDAVRDAVRGLIARRGDGAPLRVLEIGAGSGSTTNAVLSAMDGSTVEYTFTDLSPTLVAQAERDRAWPGVRFSVLDIERDPASQGLAAGRFDLIVAANVVHATADLGVTLHHARSLLHSGGALLMLEGTRPEAWVDITFGLTDGWWRFRDTDRRTDGPLLTTADWQTVLRDAGFADITALPGDSLADDAGQVLLLARAGAAANGDTTADRIVFFDARRSADASALLEVMREVAAGPDGRLWIVTENAQAIGSPARPDPDGAVLWGLGRVFALEHPDRWGGLVDVESGTSDADAERQIAAAVADPGEDQVAFRDGIRLRARLVHAAAPAEATLALDGGTCLVTGGLGGLGLRVASWLADAGAERIVLVGRSAAPEAWASDDPRHEALRALRDSGVDIVLRGVDLTDHAAVERLVTSITAEGPALRGIVHAAAVFDEASIMDMTTERLGRVLAPKVAGAHHLMDLTRDVPLDFFVMFSSTTALLGVAGLGHYAAANLYLDAFAARARADGVPALSVNWGLWDEMRLAGDSDAARYARSGLRTMDSDAALGALGRALAAGASNTVIASVDWASLRAVYESRRERPLLAELGTETAVATDEAAPQQTLPLIEELAAAPVEGRLARITAAVEDELRAVLRLTTGTLDSERGFFELGMDSLMSVELKARLEKRFGTRLPATLTFNYPTVAAVADFIADRVMTLAEQHTAADNGRPAAAAQPVAEAAKAAVASADADEETEESVAAMLEERLARLGLGGTS